MPEHPQWRKKKCMSYFTWKYPNTSRKMAKLVWICLFVYLIIYFLFLHVPKKTIQLKDLQTINGTVQSYEIPRINKSYNIAYLQLKEYSNKFFAFDRGAEYAPFFPDESPPHLCKRIN
jgi:hypothetical protein